MYPLNMRDVLITDADREAIVFVVQNDIATGHVDGRFRPDDRTTRAEWLKFALIGIGTADMQLPLGTTSPTFSDWQDHSLRQVMVAAAQRQLICGDDTGSFHPDDPITQDDAEQIVARITSEGARDGCPRRRLPDAEVHGRLKEFDEAPYLLRRHAAVIVQRLASEATKRRWSMQAVHDERIPLPPGWYASGNPQVHGYLIALDAETPPLTTEGSDPDITLLIRDTPETELPVEMLPEEIWTGGSTYSIQRTRDWAVVTWQMNQNEWVLRTASPEWGWVAARLAQIVISTQRE